VKLLLFWHLSNCMSWLSSLRSFTLKPSVGNLNMVDDNTLLFRSYKKDNNWAFPCSKPSKENHYLELTSTSMEILSIMILLEIMCSMTMWSHILFLNSFHFMLVCWSSLKGRWMNPCSDLEIGHQTWHLSCQFWLLNCLK
jgi:hypothetical protein